MLDTLATLEPAPLPKKQSAVPPRRSSLRVLVRCAFLAALTMFVAEVLRIFVGGNFHAVVPGHCYRCGQPTGDFLATVSRTHGIRAIINLRDENVGDAWYDEEKEAADRLGIQLINAGLSASDMPPAEDFVKFIVALEACPEPMLIHCCNGNDRTGMAAALYLLMRTDTPLPEARRQLSLRYGHFRWGKAGCLQRMLDSYEAYLASENLEHAAKHLHYWACNVYKPEPLPHRFVAAQPGR
jgi:protein-tyrosine phosphatase